MTNAENNEVSWKSLYKVGCMAAIIMLVYTLVTMGILILLGGQPASAQDGFDMLRENRLVGLLRLDILTIFAMPMYYLLFLALYAALKKTHRAYVVIATLLGCAGITLFLATPSVFSWLTLSDKFAIATSEEQKNLLLAAGEAILASDMWHSSSAVMGGLLLQISTLLVSVVMLWNKAFSKATAYIGIGMHGLDLVHILIGLFAPSVGAILLWIAGPFYLIWFPLLARDFFRLARTDATS